MYYRKQGIVLLSLLLVLGIALTACGPNQATEDNQTPTPGAPNGTTNGETGTEEPQVTQEQLTFYYVDTNLTNVVEEQREISYTTEEEKWTAMWSTLQSPQEEGHASLWEDIELMGVTLEQENLILDVSPQGTLQMGSSGEGYAIQTLISTYGQLEEVETIQLLINGEEAETLAGHVNISQPFSKHDVIFNEG